jgi:hypothetical protein
MSTLPVSLEEASGLGAGAALRAALRDLYNHSWRLLLLNGGLSAVLLALLVAGLWAPLAFALAIVAAGPLALALMHCAVTLAQTEDLHVAEALTGVRLHWRRGLALGLIVAGVVAAGVAAVVFYGGSGRWGLPLAALVVYLLALFLAFQLLLWPLAVFDRSTPLRVVARRAGLALFRRPLETTLLVVILLIVNLAGLAAAVIPFLTLTVAYSFLVAAHFALPHNPLRS